MEKFVATTSLTPTVNIQNAGGDLSIKGQDSAEVILKTSASSEVVFEPVGDEVTINCPEDSTIYVPRMAVIRILSVGGDASIKSVSGSLTVGSVGRELVLRDIAMATINNIGLDLSAKGVNGDLHVEHVGRAALVQDISGEFTSGSIGGHLNLRQVGGSVAAKVNGHADLSFTPATGRSYTINTGGNLSIRLIDGAPADFDITSGAQYIRLDLPGMTKKLREGHTKFSTGEGGANVKLEAGGHIEVSSRIAERDSFGFYGAEQEINAEAIETFAEEIEQQVADQMESINEQLNSVLDSFKSSHLSEEQKQRISQRVQRAQERAQQAGERARSRLERRMEQTKRKMEQRTREGHGSRGVFIGFPPPPTARRFNWPGAEASAADAAEESVSEEERMLILKMLEDGKITASEAEQLLAALEGQGY